MFRLPCITQLNAINYKAALFLPQKHNKPAQKLLHPNYKLYLCTGYTHLHPRDAHLQTKDIHLQPGDKLSS